MTGKAKRTVKLHHAMITVIAVVLFVFTGIVVWKSGPQVPLTFGCMAAGLMAFYLGYTWEEILDGMLQSIMNAVEAILILMLIGMLVGTWIAAGTVPTLISCGLSIVSARAFLPTAMLICTVVASAIGSWGTVGTMGLAFMGIGLPLGIPAPMIAGAVISGAYMGEVISPLSDATNLAAGVAGVDVFAIVRRIFPPALTAGAICLLLYVIAGLRFGAAGAQTVAGGIAPVQALISSHFRICLPALLPLIVIVICIVGKLPAIPSMLAGALTGMVLAVLLQGESMPRILQYAYEGYTSRTGNEMMDTLLSAGGMHRMLEPISVILLAMAFGGIMQCSGQMEALVTPLLARVRTGTGMTLLTVLTCAGMNALLSDQYLSISMPGQMYMPESDRRKIPRAALGAVLLGGGAVTSPLIPWNTCGIYCRTTLGVSTAAYMPFMFLGMVLPVVTVLRSFLSGRRPDRKIT